MVGGWHENRGEGEKKKEYTCTYTLLRHFFQGFSSLIYIYTENTAGQNHKQTTSCPPIWSEQEATLLVKRQEQSELRGGGKNRQTDKLAADRQTGSGVS